MRHVARIATASTTAWFRPRVQGAFSDAVLALTEETKSTTRLVVLLSSGTGCRPHNGSHTFVRYLPSAGLHLSNR
jgi:hypothetical protein